MITKLDSIQSGILDLTGNSSIVQNGGDLYVIGNVKSNNTFSVYKSTDFGETFTAVASASLQSGTKKFDPTVFFDGTIIHILASVANSTDSSRYDIIKYNFDTTGDTLGSPISILGDSREHAGYDITVLSSGVRIVVATVWDATGHANYNVLAIELNSSDVITSTTVLYTTDIRTGETFGGISLVSPDGIAVDLYYSTHLKTIYLANKTININKRSRTAPATWGSESLITSYVARYTDDKLTVINYNSGYALAQSYIIANAQGGLVYSSIFGIYDPVETSWTFGSANGDIISGYGEATLALNAANELRLALLNFPIVNGAQANEGSLRVFDIGSDLSLSEITGHFNSLNFKWLRGSKGTADNTSKWLLVGYTKDPSTELGDAYYVSDFNLPPVIVVSPTSATLTRGIPLLINAINSFDPDLDPLTFSWSNDDITGQFTMSTTSGPFITVVANKAIGPSARTIHVQLDLNDGINGTVSTTIPLTVPLNHAPTIIMPSSPTVQRNDTITITPTVSDSDGDDLTYSWTQTAGTSVPMRNTSLVPVDIDLYRTNPAGETLTFQLTVSDAINSPVSDTINVVVPAISGTLVDNNTLKKSLFSSVSIDSRNIVGSWSALAAETPSHNSDFKDHKISVTSSDSVRKTFISNKSAFVTDEKFIDGTASFFRRCIAYKGAIKDAIHTEDEATYLLVYDSIGGNNILMKYTSAGFTNISDYPDQQYDLSNISTSLYTKIFSTKSFNGKRIFFLTGEDGMLLLQVLTTDVTKPQQALFLDTSTHTLFGANDIQFVRFVNVESVNSGNILVGTKNSDGLYFETLIDLSLKRIVATWDRDKLISDMISTGELLFGFNDQYGGKPSKPFLNPIVNPSGDILVLSWTQIRADLVDFYEIEVSIDGGSFSLVQRIGSGSIFTYTGSFDIEGHEYTFRIRAGNEDGLSNYSNTRTIGLPPAPSGPLSLLYIDTFGS